VKSESEEDRETVWAFLFPSTLALQLTLYYDALILKWVWKVRAKKIAKRSELFFSPQHSLSNSHSIMMRFS